ncbi:hypothetical protein F5J12DRAFT_787576 [Pisolithus orientalis]|uniref:uncharacterized protein n=1 Tax=Pisolithus orientalis TaxID=936130 RepID=UPI0022246AE4|nr:uncharacterized protein F5J12DRAFT_787576 [Pisolithus orientalis]KAI5984395.1 hypothetical protein F5J12DRAFT_787576 [Pisolithus orientalis]
MNIQLILEKKSAKKNQKMSMVVKVMKMIIWHQSREDPSHQPHWNTLSIARCPSPLGDYWQTSSAETVVGTTVGHSIKIMNVRLPPSEDEDKDDTDYHNLTATDDCPITSHQLPKMCPGMDCKDAIPDSISNQLKTALSTYIGLIKERKTNIHLGMDISLKDAEAKGWPAMKIKFKDIPSRILEITVFLNACPSNVFSNMGKLMLQVYLTYFVIPHVICQFVTQDFSLLLTMPTHNIMVESNNVGKLINPKHDDDNELDQIKHAITFALNQRNLEGQTIHDAAKALVALQYAKTTDVLGTSGMHFLL